MTFLATLAQRSGILPRLRSAWKDDMHSGLAPLQREVRRLTEHIEALQGTLDRLTVRLAEVDQAASQSSAILRLNAAQRELVDRLPRLLDPVRVPAAVRAAIGRAERHDDPYPHCVVDPLLPEDVYRALLRAIPPAAFFGARDPIKQNLRIPIEFGPEYATRVWSFVHETIAPAIVEAATAKFAEPLMRHYETLFGGAAVAAARLPQAISGGRLMLRRPGYHLAPHRDPKRSMLTCLLYLARPGDSEEHGTALYRVAGDAEASFVETYYPGEYGHACTLARMVPYRPNSMVIFLNGNGAHGADIPADAPAGLERHAFQFYVGPEGDALDALVASLPPDRRALWRKRKQREGL